MSPSNKQTTSRQQPGLACEACRSRKLRCDREQPQCGTCQAASIPCIVDYDRLPRGRKGSVRTLSSRIGTFGRITFLVQRLTRSDDLKRKLADMEKQRSEASASGKSTKSRSDIGPPICGNQPQVREDQTLEDPIRESQHFATQDVACTSTHQMNQEALCSTALSLDATFAELMNHQESGIQSLHTPLRQDSVIDPPGLNSMFSSVLSDANADLDLTAFGTQNNSGLNVDFTSSKDSWPSLPLSDLIIADL